MNDFPDALSRAGAPLRRLVAAVLSSVCLFAAASTQAAPGADSSALPATHGPILSAWHTPEVAGGALAPTIVLRLLVGRDGAVKQAQVKQKRNELAAAEKQAMDAARSFHFQPAIKDGKPVESWITFAVPLKATRRAREVVIKGSDTIDATLMPAWVEAWRRARPKSSAQVEALGSSTAFAGLLDGTADVGASSRLIDGDELALADNLGIQLYEVYAGYDGIAVIVHPDNPLRELELENVAKLFSERVTNWSELGGPDAPVHAFGRPGYSGTNAFFKEHVLGCLGPAVEFGSNVRRIEKTEDIVEAVAKDPLAIGYVGLGHVTTAVRALALRVSSDAAGVLPSPVTIRDGTYPVSRPLVLYVRTDSTQDARSLVDFALSREGQALVDKSGFVPLPPSVGTFASEQPAPHVAPPQVIRIFFEPNSHTIESDSRLDMISAENAVRASPLVMVIGNTDISGNAEDNRRLAQQRADAVAARLRQYVHRDAEIRVLVAVSAHPLATNSTSEGRRMNRRVDVIVPEPSCRQCEPRAPQPAEAGRAPEDHVSRR